MRIKILKLLVLGFLIAACALPVLFLSGKTSSEPDPSSAGMGLSSVETFDANYKAWEAEYVKNGGDKNMVLAMGWFKGLSTGDSQAKGVANLNLVDGVVSVEINGLSKEEGWDLWVIDSAAGSIMPESNDSMLRLGSLKHEGKLARFDASLGSDTFKSFDMDLIIITKAGKNPTEDRTLVGTTSLFHRVYRSAQRGQFGVLADADPVPPAPDKRGVIQQVVDAINPTASAQIGPIPNPSTPQQVLITAGRQSFFNDTFQGNGRTCGTCHREDNNLTIDAEFIETLPPNDPLFVAEFMPALSANFENPVLMRKFGLILENPDGFGNLATRFVMRGVPHTLALLPNTLAPLPGDGTTVPPNERTGWGGDGAPGTGTLREFIIGAITQHYPKTLARQAGSDFILPTVAQLDALEAFQKSAGRRQDLVLSGPGALSLKGEMPRKGQEIFINPGNVFGGSNEGAGKCNLCHLNAGAGDFFAVPSGSQNANFNTNVEQLPSQPADLVIPAQLNPADGGFGGGTSPSGGIGNGSFNTPVLVEAADTPPFFHNNSITTIEGAVDFYNSEAFNNPPGFGSLIGGIRLEATEVEAVAAFLRVINALENIRSSIDLENRAKVAVSFSQAQELLKLSISELEDAIEVLDCGQLHPDAVRKLREALAIDVVALVTPNQGARNALINQAITRKNQAKNIMQN
jgi:cytochrome c peroxidase